MADLSRLRAQVLYYFARAHQDQVKRVLRSELGTWLQWPVPSDLDLAEVVAQMPDDVSVDWTDTELVLCAGSGVAPRRKQDVKEVFDYWKLRTGRTSTVKFSADRTAKIKARLAEGFSTEDLKKAVDGMMSDPFYTGDNDRGGIYTDIQHCMKNAATVERLMGQVGRAQLRGTGSANVLNDAEDRTRNRRIRGRRKPT